MIQIASVVPTVTTAPVPSALRVAESGASSFALALSSLLVPAAKAVARPGAAAAPETALPALQIAAAPGKELPEIGLELSKDETEAEPESDAKEAAPAEQDPTFAWFALPAPPPSEQPPVAIAAAVARAVRVETPEIAAVMPEMPQAAAPEAQSAPEPATIAAPIGEGTPATPEAAARPATPAARSERDSVTIPRAVPAASGEATAAPAPPIPAPAAPAGTPAPAPATAIETRAAAAPPVRAEAPAQAVPAAPTAPAAPAPAPAPEIDSAPALAGATPAAAQAIVFAPPRRAVAREPDQPAVTSVAAPAAAALPQVAAASDAQQGALDMRRQEWMGQMVERIEALRDAAPIRETRIALVPDVLGKVDISVRHDGERVHVHFTAETQAARQILADAQPRLAEIAESRGVRLGQTSVDSGQAGANAQSGQRQDAPRPQTPSAPPRARAETEFTATEERVA